MMEYTAKLNNWRTEEYGDHTCAYLRAGDMVIWGEVEGDKLGRYADGKYISTSPLPVAVYQEGDIVVTRNNNYLLGQPMPVH